MARPPFIGSTLDELIEKFAIGARAERQWNLISEAALNCEAQSSGVESASDIGQLHNAMMDMFVSSTGIALRAEFEKQFPPRRLGRPGTDRALCLIVVFLVNEEKKLDPTIKHTRALKHVARLLGPDIGLSFIRSAYDRGVATYRNQAQDQLGFQSLVTLWQEFNKFWDEHKKSEKYAKDRAVCRKLRGRKSCYEMDRSIEWAK